MAAMSSGDLSLNGKVITHLDRCLLCRSCENVCPNGVSFGKLLEASRGVVREKRGAKGSLIRGALIRLFSNHLYFEKLLKLARFANALGIVGVVRRLKLPRSFGWAMDGVLKLSYKAERWAESYRPKGEVKGKVGLFLGCVARRVDVDTLNAAIYVLNKLGFCVLVPSSQGCCGAIHASQGEANEFSLDVLRKFEAAGCHSVVVSAAGCAAMLVDFAGRAGVRVFEICDFVANQVCLDKLDISPLQKKVFVHEPCTMRNVLRGQRHVYAMLARIPNLVVEELPGNDQCCGAAGLYHILQPRMAGMLVTDKVDEIKAADVEMLLTTNIGCALHVRGAAMSNDISLEVLHPLLLLARQMGFKD